MTKTDRIRQLGRHQIFTDREIADIVARELGSCSQAYVRVVLRQRPEGGMSEHDKRWRANNRQRYLAYQKAYYRRKRQPDRTDAGGLSPSA